MCGEVFYGITGVLKWRWWVNDMGKGGVECLPFWLQASSSRAATWCFWVWAIGNLRLWALLSLFILQGNRERSNYLLTPPKQASSLILSTKLFFQNSRYQIECDSCTQQGSRISPTLSLLHSWSIVVCC